jgi:hypothetical protein
MKPIFDAERLSLECIEGSPHIQSWLKQFNSSDRTTAVDLLLKLQFISSDVYREWLKSALPELEGGPFACYAVRKFDRDEQRKIWDNDGTLMKRKEQSQGSEDFVRSLIANLKRADRRKFLDHADLNHLRKYRVKQIVFIDDSIGSGTQTATYIEHFFNNRTILSWWSYGCFSLTIVSFVRNVEAEQCVIDALPGSSHGRRKFPKTKKLNFVGPLTYHASFLKARWGIHAEEIKELCLATQAIPREKRLGFGDTMSNVIFKHSVPNNIPGILWCKSRDWEPLFPGRFLPTWVSDVLDANRSISREPVSSNLLALLLQVKRGVRSFNGLSRSLGFDVPVIKQMLSQCFESGFVNENNRLTKAGAQVIWNSKEQEPPTFDRSLYVPRKWRVDRDETSAV